MTDEIRDKYLKVVNIICEQFGLNKPNQIIYVCEALENLIEPYMKENAELKEKIETYDAQIEKMENCWNCKFFKEKKYQACIDSKKNNTKCCAFYKWELAE